MGLSRQNGENELRDLVRAGQICAMITLALGAAGIAGWIFDEPISRTLWKGGSEMKFNTAVALTAMGVGLLSAMRRAVWAKVLARIAAGLLLLISVPTVLQYVFSANFGIDELFFRDSNFVATTHPGRMAWYTASSVVLLGTGILLLTRKTGDAAALTQWLALAAGFFPLQALIGYFYATMAVLGMTAQTGYMSIPTAIALLCGAGALLLHAPGRGIMAVLTSATPGSVASRALMIVLVIVPLAMGWVALSLVRRGEHTIEYGIATVALITVVLLVTLTWLNAFRLNKAEEALRDREEQLRFVTDHVPVFIVQCDADTRYKFVNAAYAERFPSRAEDIVGKKIREVVGSRAYESFRHHVETALAGKRVEFEEKIPYEQFGERWMHCIYVPEKALGGEVIGFVAVIHDVTTRRAAEEALRESEEHFRSLAEGMPHMVWECDRFGAWHYRNAAWTEYSGAAMESVPASSWLNYYHPDDQLLLTRAWNETLRSQGAIRFDVEARMRRQDGVYRWFRVTAAAVRNAAGEIVKWAGTCTDIDEQKRAHEVLEHTVKERTARLRETVHELEAFSYSIAHDMRAPLRAMQGFAAILEQEYASQLDGTARSYLQRLVTASGRMDRLIVDILNYSKVVRGELDLAPVDVQKLIGTIIESYPNLDAGRADIQIEGALPLVRANEAALTQVISNLLGNAVKFVAPDVRPRVRIYAEGMSVPGEADMVAVCFEDNGIGMPRESQKRLFNIFTRLNRPGLYEGSGIGLAIVKKAVERMGGRVGVESEPGKGSRFRVELRRADGI